MEVKDKILEIFTDVIGEQVTEESTCEDMCFDSLDTALVSLEIDSAFGVKLTDGDFDKAKNVGDIIILVVNKLKNDNTK